MQKMYKNEIVEVLHSNLPFGKDIFSVVQTELKIPFLVLTEELKNVEYKVGMEVMIKHNDGLSYPYSIIIPPFEANREKYCVLIREANWYEKPILISVDRIENFAEGSEDKES